MTAHQVKDYIIINQDTEYVLYVGNNAFHASQAFYSVRNPKLMAKGQIQTAVFNHIAAIQERLN